MIRMNSVETHGRFNVVLLLTSAFFLLGPGRRALAYGTYNNQIPNGQVYGCDACHGASMSELNAFGLDVRSRVTGGVIDWPSLFDLDSDGDSQTNGQELGDPCGVWASGQTPGRTEEISNPGDMGSVSSDPDTPSCIGSDAGLDATVPEDAGTPDSGAAPDAAAGPDAAGGGGGKDDGGCSCRLLGSDAGGRGASILPALLALGLLLLLARRRG